MASYFLKGGFRLFNQQGKYELTLAIWLASSQYLKGDWLQFEVLQSFIANFVIIGTTLAEIIFKMRFLKTSW